MLRIPAFLISCIALSSAHAATITLQGSFVSNFDTTSSSYQGIPTLSGTWTLFYNEPTNPNAGGSMHTVALQSLVMNVPIGTTTFTHANAAATVSFTGTQVTNVTIGGILGGVGAISTTTDDFWVQYNPQGQAFVSALTVATRPSNQFTTTGSSGSHAVIPEPASSSLGALGLALLVLRRRR